MRHSSTLFLALSAALLGIIGFNWSRDIRPAHATSNIPAGIMSTNDLMKDTRHLVTYHWDMH